MARKKHRFLNFIKKFFPTIRKIGPNQALIVKNVYAKKEGSKVKVFYNRVEQPERGWRFIVPFFQETEIISIKEEMIDYPSMAFNDRIGQKLTVDFTAKVKVTDAKKYQFKHGTVKEQLKSDLESIVLPFIRKFDYEELSNLYFKLPPSGTKLRDIAVKVIGPDGKPKYYYNDYSLNIDSLGRFISGTPLSFIEVELIKIREHFDQFEKDYGLKIIDISNKKVNPSEEMQKSFDQLEKIKRQAAAAEEQARAKRKIADINKETIEIYNELERQRILNKIIEYQNQGYSHSQIVEMMKSDFIASGLRGEHGNNPAATGALSALYANQFMNSDSEEEKAPKVPKK